MTATHIRVRTIIQSLIGAFGLWAALALGGLAHANHTSEESTFSQENRRGSSDESWRQKEQQNRREADRQEQDQRHQYEESGRKNDSGSRYQGPDTFGSFSDGKYKSCERANNTVYCY